MTILTTPSHEPVVRTGLETQAPAVINVRRPAGMRAEMPHGITQPQVELWPLDDAPPPPTALRLPDLGAIVKHLRKRHVSLGAAAQWAGIGLGGLLAMWLIFGNGRPVAVEVNEAPAWRPPGGSQVQTAPPAWQTPADAAPSPAFSQPPVDAESPSSPSSSPAAAGLPDNQSPYQNDPVPPQLPDWDESARSALPPAGADSPAARTAQRESVPAEPVPASHQPGEAPPLGITVPVPQ
jgi:hypothetical protein